MKLTLATIALLGASGIKLQTRTKVRDDGPTCDEAFSYLDANHNGEITEHEAETQLKAAVNAGELSKSDAIYIFNALGKSTGADNMVNRHEFAKVWKREGGPGVCHPDKMKLAQVKVRDDGPTCDQAFSYLDANHNGEITEQEAETQLKAAVNAGELSKSDAMYIFNALGKSTGADNMVNRAEFAKVWKREGGPGVCHPSKMELAQVKVRDDGPTCDQAFSYLDANHNGQITEQEAETQLKAAVNAGELSKSDAIYIFNALGKSTGADNMVDRAEFAKVWKREGGPGVCHPSKMELAQAKDGGPTCDEAFNYLDENHNGQITEQEAEHQLKAAVNAGKLSKKDAMYIFNTLGKSTGADNMVSKAEFKKVWAEQGGPGRCHLNRMELAQISTFDSSLAQLRDLSDPTCAEAFHYLDENHDGHITQQEAINQLGGLVAKGTISLHDATQFFVNMSQHLTGNELVTEKVFGKAWGAIGMRDAASCE